ncbi:MAG: AAA family ATPase, partial [Muribaculaceae bacterium]|nr:AAA family ATPase [Muribaculaceae bacterium]
SCISEISNIIPDLDSSNHNIKKRNVNYYFQETLNDFLDASDKLKNVPLNYLGLSLDVEKKGENKKYFIKPIDNSYLPIEWKYASSGIQTSSSIPTIVDYFANSFSFKDAISRSIISYLYETDTLRLYKPELEPMNMKKMVHIHIEEPELNLYPTAQCRLMDCITKEAFMSVADDRELRLIIATHSPYIINYLNVLINRKGSNQARIDKENLAVYRIYDGMLQNLIATDDVGRIFVDTQDLTEQMEEIMAEYEYLTNLQ